MQSWFDVTRSTFHKEMRDKTMLRFRPSAVDLLTTKIFFLQYLMSGLAYISTNLKFLRLSHFELIEGMGQTDGRTYRQSASRMELI